MNKTKKILSLFSLLFIFNCTHTIKVNDFSKSNEKENQTKVIIGFEFKYDGSPKYIGKGFTKACHIIFKDENNKTISHKASQDSYEKDYIMLNTNAKKIFLSYIDCNQYRILYNKNRFRTIEQEIISSPIKNKINYAGHIEIDWDPEIFKATDLLLLGHLWIQDEGNFTMKINNNYSKYINFMQFKFNIDKKLSTNSINTNLAGKTIIDN